MALAFVLHMFIGMNDTMKNLSEMAKQLGAEKSYVRALELAKQSFPGLDLSIGAVLTERQATAIASALGFLGTKGGNRMWRAVVGAGLDCGSVRPMFTV